MSMRAAQIEIPSPGPPREFHHEAFLYTGEDRFLAGVVPFIHDAIAAGEPILVAVSKARIRLLTSVLGAGAGRVRFLDMGEVGRNPARIIPVWRDFLDVHGVADRPVRGIGEPVWPGRSAAELAECRHHESLLNLAFDDAHPWRLMCPYDVEALDSEALELARGTHPFVVDEDGIEHESKSYVSPADAPGPFDGPLPEPETRTAAMAFTDDDLAELRTRVHRHACEAGMDPQRTANAVLAINELAANSVRHAGGGGTVRLWTEPGELVGEVSDGGRFDSPLVGRVRPTPVQLYGRGLWLVNQICDLVQIRSAERGSAVRIRMRLE
jgi:anti-sigma regulatory factor (Ser/Thr protein kinase)